MAFNINDLSPQGASIWQQLSPKDKTILIDTTSKQQTDKNLLGFIASTKNLTRKCCQRGTPSGELTQFREILAHRKMSIDDGSFCGSPYLLSILWQNGQITDVPICQVMHDSSKICTEYALNNELSIYGDEYDRISAATQLTHALMRLALITTNGNVPCAIELYDAYHFKLLLLDICDSNRLMSEIHDKKLNELLESITQQPFHQRTIQKLMCLILEARLLPASICITPSMEVFNKDHITGDDTDPNIMEETRNNTSFFFVRLLI